MVCRNPIPPHLCLAVSSSLCPSRYSLTKSLFLKTVGRRVTLEESSDRMSSSIPGPFRMMSFRVASMNWVGKGEEGVISKEID